MNKEKSGIIKNNIPVLLGPFCEPKDVFIQKSQKTGSKLYSVELVDEMVSDFDKINQKLAHQAAIILRNDRNFECITLEAIMKGIQEIPKCRKELVPFNQIPKFSKTNLIYLDVGHNPEGLEHILRTLMMKHPSKNINIVYAVSYSKDIQACLEVVNEFAHKIYFTCGSHPKLTKSDEMSKAIEDFYAEKTTKERKEFKFIPNLLEAMETAILEGTSDCVILATGTFFIMSDLRKYFNYKDKYDPPEVNLSMNISR